MRVVCFPPLFALLAGVLLIAEGSGVRGEKPPPKPTPESRALAFLAREVPRWSAENQCFSCHNNGDAARTLYAAVRLSHPVPGTALADTSRWLADPRRWEKQDGDAAFKDAKLACLQFAAALIEAIDAGQVKDRSALAQAAARVAAFQKKDGFWLVDAGESIGSPVTYGTCLATVQARRVLYKADPEKYRDAITKADIWLRQVRVGTVLDAAAVLLALEAGKETATQRQRCLELIRKGQAKNGGWGPYVNSPPEVFDTAVVLLALVRQAKSEEMRRMTERGRAFLLAEQQADGSWPATTRPPGRESYAQQLSTTGWATLALLAARKQ
jgi:hypothetical protein